ncbi:MAG: hypothetical protein OSA85_00490 [Psychrobacter pacificensis]|uniref:hypothetical protein n=1 Tax=Psychrobacter pacificensis TaxID=112002 RepID=UPI00239DC25D|nr:hypothetical protein [Psychrobacter pacificensis]MDE0842532.1 hypothetical protein [Psychrobacter pacificensis]
MAIQLPDPGNGIPEDKTGDNEHVMWLKVKDNFSNVTHAASKMLGATKGNVPLAQDVFKASYGMIDSVETSFTPEQTDALDSGTRVVVPRAAIASPLSSADQYFLIETKAMNNIHLRGYQEAIGIISGFKIIRMCDPDRVWGAWQSITTQSSTYTTTTASGANVAVDSSGKLMRSTSSERYKDIIADLVLTDDAYANAMSLAPIVYRSTADADNADWRFYSFSAEALGAFDPAFVLWRHTETVTDADGNMTEQPLAEPQAEGLNINALLAFNHAIAIRQDEMIKAQAETIATLTARVNDLAQKLEA